MDGWTWLGFWVIYLAPIIGLTWFAVRTGRNPAFWLLCAVLLWPAAAVGLAVTQGTRSALAGVDAAPTAQPETGPGSIRTLAAWLIATAAFCVSLGIISALPDREPRQGLDPNGPGGRAAAEAEAVRRVTNARRTDGMRFDAWVEMRARRLCRFIDDADPAWTATTISAGDDPTFLVTYTYGSIEGCPESVTHHGVIVQVSGTNGRVGRNEDLYGTGRTWLGDFEAGDAA